jgi:hypothetical protein
VGYRDVEEREMERETEIDAIVRSPNDIEIAYLFFSVLGGNGNH